MEDAQPHVFHFGPLSKTENNNKLQTKMENETKTVIVTVNTFTCIKDFPIHIGWRNNCKDLN